MDVSKLLCSKTFRVCARGVVKHRIKSSHLPRQEAAVLYRHFHNHVSNKGNEGVIQLTKTHAHQQKKKGPIILKSKQCSRRWFATSHPSKVVGRPQSFESGSHPEAHDEGSSDNSADHSIEPNILAGEKARLSKTEQDESSHKANRQREFLIEDDAPFLASRRVDPATVRQVYYFDTLALTKKLEAKGFTRDQAEGCAECLVEIINTTLDHQGRHMVTKPQQEIAVQQLYSEIVSVKKDLTLLQKSEFSTLKNETQKMSIQMTQIQDHLNDEIVKLKGHFTLDINLEKGRAIEAHAANEKKLQILHNKIDTEVANLKTVYEKYRNDIFKYAGGSVLAVGSLVLGVIRLMH